MAKPRLDGSIFKRRLSGNLPVKVALYAFVALVLAAAGAPAQPPDIDLALVFGEGEGQGVDGIVFVEGPHPIDASPQPVTLEAWVKWGGRTRPASGIWGRMGGATAYHWEITPDGMRIRMHEVEMTELTAPPVGEWAHVAVSWEPNTLRYFLNGELVAAAEGDRGDFLLENMAIGASHGAGPAATRVFDGAIADFRVWNVARSEEQIWANMARRLTGEEEGLVGYWPLNEQGGLVAKDLSGGWKDGAIGGALVWMPPAGWFVRDIDAMIAEVGETVTFGPVELRNPRGDVTYQWYFNYRPIEEATGDSLTVANITEEDMGEYHVAVNDEREQTPVKSRRAWLAEPDWPMWRFDAARSASANVELADELHLQWVIELPEPKRAWPHQWDDGGKLDFDVSYAPVVKGSRIFVPSNVTDSVTAYSIEDGSEIWRFYADGPVRLAPAAWRDKVYFVSDDGHLYCVDAENGQLVWKFRGGPSDHRLLGNERIINFWAARGGALVKGGTVYFAAGFWPLHGVFVYALDAESGEVIWVNDTISSEYVNLPHGGADGYGGLAPQGYIAAGEGILTVSGGRAPAARLDMNTGELVKLDPREDHKGGGGYAVNSDGMGMMRNQGLAGRVSALVGRIDGEVFYKLGARGRLFVSTTGGSIYCFGPDEVEPVRHEFIPADIAPRDDKWADVAVQLLNELGENEGYALILGAGSGDLMRELLVRSGLHVVVVDGDPAAVRSLRDELAAANMYGRRAAVIEADPASFSVQPYLFSMVSSEDAGAAGIAADEISMKKTLGWLRPYGGVAYLGGDNAVALAEAAATAAVDQVSAEARDGHLFARRAGPLTGAGQWTHQYHDAANTLMSRDRLVRLPLGVLWFGGPNHDNILPRHSGGPRPKVAGGRQVYLGVETIAARCVYTGRQLWEREFPGIGHPFTNLALENQWAQGRTVYMSNIPGATYIGSPFVALPDSIYLRYNEVIHRIDPATGETAAVFEIPGRRVAELYPDEDVMDWGHLKAVGDYLVTTAEPHLFEDQRLGWTNSYSGTSSRIIAVMNRFSGEIIWQREARIGFRHNAIVCSGEALFLIDGLSENALEHLARRGMEPDEKSIVYALNLADGEEIWKSDSDVFGTYLLYSAERDILVEGGSQDLRHRLGDEPRQASARRGRDGGLIWQGRGITLPGVVRGDMLIPGRPGDAISILTGQTWHREQPHTGARSNWNYRRAYGCNTLNASEYLLLFRTGYAGFFDLEHDAGTGNFGGFRSGCTANLIAADGVLNALDYTRSCTCSYAMQTSLALIHMPDDPNIEFWMRLEGAFPDPERFGLNFGAPGRRVDSSGMIWHDRTGQMRRHPSAVQSVNGLAWVAASAAELRANETINIDDLLAAPYTVRLHFAELDGGVEAGDRVFDVTINGEKALDGFDVVGEAGGALREVVREFSVDVDGRLRIGFSRSDGSELNPIISGIELIAGKDN